MRAARAAATHASYARAASLQARSLFQHQMIAAFQRYKARARNAGGEPASLFERLHCIVAAMEHQRRCPDPRQ